VKFGKRRAFVEGNVCGFATLDLVLRRFRARVAGVAFDFEIGSMHANDPTADPACLGIPTHTVADLEFVRHGVSARLLDACNHQNVPIEFSYE
jgi:hypothetical protein